MYKKLLIGIIAGITLIMGGIYMADRGYGSSVETFASVDEIAKAEKLTNGKYIQVQKNDKTAKLGKNLPEGYIVHEYVAPEGPGFAILWEDKENYYSVGFGPEAESRTYTYPK